MTAVAIPFALFLSFFILLTQKWIDRTFGGADVNSTLLTLLTDRANLKSANRQFVETFKKKVILYTIVLSTLCSAIYAAFANDRLNAYLRSAAAFLDENPGYAALLPFISIVILVVFLVTKFLISYIRNRKMDLTYFDPDSASIDRVKDKNLIIIYFESMEASYRDSAVFGENLLDSLDRLGGLSFDRLRPERDVTFSLSAMTAGLLSLPLTITWSAYRAFRDRTRRPYLAGAKGLGDILAARGYHNVYMCGSSLRLHAIGSFFAGHGFHEVLGSEQLAGTLPASQRSSWGLYDEHLLERALTKINDLRARGQRHCVVVGTIDTHGPKGVISPRLRHSGEPKTYPGIVKASAASIADFIKALDASGALADTNVAVVGDHLMPSGEIVSVLKRQTSARSLYNRFYSADGPQPSTREISQFDLMATFLEFAGFRIKGGCLGLGRSGFSSEPPPARVPGQTPEGARRLTARDYSSLWVAPASSE